ncbi:hypothetical protein L226DRAFT_535983 [Lentinus tigrinus ALCF2SS1-7]|uniref:uncharacterized protein n=1 Tax=Lentinus tigrinus ALCF2SS1-7 TaxID=1328758 RepID=UPI0011662DBA|nr:hypothetical protein L226DRAFT_535983 [Lentinus tigrinus ALCF2SS1-7]
MDGSDDYFGDDDFVLDETTLAVLDREEQKWQQQQTQTTAARPRRPVSQEAPEPLPKRRKTSHETTPEGLIPQLRAVNVGNDYDEDLPDISIIGDGSYNLPAAQRASLAAQVRRGQSNYASTSNRHPPPRPRAPAPAPPQRRTSSESGSVASASQATGSRPPQRNRMPRQHSTLSSVQAALANFVPPAASSPRGPPSRGSPVPGPSRVTPTTAVRPAVRTPPAAVAQRVTRDASPSVPVAPGRRQSVAMAGPPRQHRASPPSIRPPQPPPPQPPLSQGQSERNLRIEVETLRAQVEDLMKAQKKATSDLEEALNVRYAKEGEVSILRKSIEKAAKDHVAEVARIKTAKEEAEAMQVQIRKEMREELERVKTQYLFKQHELETSARKTPWSNKIRRTEPVSSTQRRQTVEDQQPLQTPSRPSAAAASPKRQHRKKVIHVPESPPKIPAKLRGFFNAFDVAPSQPQFDLSQVAQSTQAGKKGKGRASVSYDENVDLFFNPPSTSSELQHQEPPSQPSSSNVRHDVSMREVEVESQPQSSPPDSSVGAVVASETQDEKKGEKGKKEDKKKEPEPQPQPFEPAEPILTPDSREVQRIIIMHRHGTVEPSTLQRFIDHALPSTASPKHVQAYSAHIAQLLDDVGAFSPDVERVLRDVTTTLCSIGRILCDTKCLSLLAALVDILKALAFLIIPYVPTLLAPSTPESSDSPPEILEFLTTLVRSLLNPKMYEKGEDRSALLAACLGLFEAISWYTPSELMLRLTYFVRAPQVLNVLADPKHPIWATRQFVRTLALLATYRDFYKYLIKLETSDDVEEENAGIESGRMVYLEQLSMMLVTRDKPEHNPLRESIIRFLWALIVHDDPTTRAILVQSDLIVPAVIHFAHHITDPLYEEDEEFMESPERVTWNIDMIWLVVPLLGRILQDTDFDQIRHKLVNLEQDEKKKTKTFPGLFHMFTVALGRVGYSPLPARLSEENATKLENLHKSAQNTLEFVVDGPEMELIYEAFQTQTESSAARPKQRRRPQHQTQDDEIED